MPPHKLKRLLTHTAALRRHFLLQFPITGKVEHEKSPAERRSRKEEGEKACGMSTQPEEELFLEIFTEGAINPIKMADHLLMLSTLKVAPDDEFLPCDLA